MDNQLKEPRVPGRGGLRYRLANMLVKMVFKHAQMSSPKE